MNAASASAKASASLHLGDRDLAAARLPHVALRSFADNGADRQTGVQQRIGECPADLAGDSCDCVHQMSPLSDVGQRLGAARRQVIRAVLRLPANSLGRSVARTS
jgi:hypothetical protein